MFLGFTKPNLGSLAAWAGRGAAEGQALAEEARAAVSASLAAAAQRSGLLLAELRSAHSAEKAGLLQRLAELEASLEGVESTYAELLQQQKQRALQDAQLAEQNHAGE